MSNAELTSVLLTLCDGCLVGAVMGCIFMLVEAAFVLRFAGAPLKAAPHPPVTVLKPLHGAEPGLPVRLAAFCSQDYAGPVQLVCGANDDDVPAIEAVQRTRTEFPAHEIETALDSRSHGSNRKISNLINMLPQARYDVLVLSDSDIVVGPRYLRDIVTLLAQPNAGAVTCLYHGISGDNAWSRLGALAINTQFLPQAITAAGAALGQHCCGATIALRRTMLDRIGGLGVFADMLADDYAIGVAVRAAGYDVVTAPFLVGHRCFEASLRDLFLHQIRVARTIRSIEPIGYAGTIITHPWPLALLGMLSGGATAALVVAAALVSRVALCRCVERRFGLPRQSYWLIPVHDLIAFAVYVASFFGATVQWQGAEYRVAADGTLIEDKT